MIMLFRSFIFLLIISLASCVSTQSNMTAANDEDQDIGLGGTGLLANTGSGLGGTGILGEITGYGSIFVNGIEVEYDSRTVFTIDGKAATYQQLEIGDVVEVLTTDDSQHTYAQKINLRHEVIGNVESVDPQTYSFKVHGQTVIQAIDKGALPEVKTTVAVSGFRIDEQTILSTRVVSLDTKQSLLRTNIELPFKEKTDRWLVQLHVQNAQAIFQLDGIKHILSLQEKTGESLKSSLNVRVLQLHKSTSDKLKLDRVIKPLELPRGRQSLMPVQRPGSNMQPGTTPALMPGTTPGVIPGPMPGSINNSNQSEKYRGGR